ncbi:cytochrome c biogenesis protein CcsA [Candidatus Pelagibacter sp.]|nr:cytochrome c biogenesis protein CcsA [Candidatus Pelagibacter sp.]
MNSDFSNETVFNNSHTTKPLFYKISGTWGNHEGSLLLWLLVLTLFIFLFLIKSREQPKKYRILTLLFQQIIIIGFFLFVLMTSNPFNYLFPIPNEGLGLNPILQDPALAIHPPNFIFRLCWHIYNIFIISCCSYAKLCFKTMGTAY